MFKKKSLVAKGLLIALIFSFGLITGGVIVRGSSTSFSDVSPADWFYTDVMNVVAWGVVRGNSDGTFAPARTINRAEFATMLNRYDKYLETKYVLKDTWTSTHNPTDPAITDMSGVTFDDSEILGSKNAKVTLIEFADFECPFSKRLHDTITNQLKTDYIDTGKVRLIFKNYAFLTPDSVTAAEGLYCAKDQGKYWEYHDYLYDNQGVQSSGWVNKENLKVLAKTMGFLNVTNFSNCLDKETYKDKVTADMAEGQKVGVNGTPSSFVNGESIPGAQPYATFKAMIDKKLAE